MIHILWPTIRPEAFKKMHQEWINRSDVKGLIKTYVAVNKKEHYDYLKDYLNNDYIIEINVDKIGVCYPGYQLTSKLGIDFGKCENHDIVIFASDDFLAPQSWDTYLNNKFEGKGDIGLFVRDGYQKPDSSNMLHPAITIPILTYGALLKLNRYIYHPAYTHMFSDCELYDNLKDLDLLYDDRINDETTFEHLHYAAGKRKADNMDLQYNMKWKEDEFIWNERRKMDVEERILKNVFFK